MGFWGGIDAFFVIFAKGFGSLWARDLEYGGFVGITTVFLYFGVKNRGFCSAFG